MWAWRGFENALRMGWEVWWALVLGFALSALVQAWVPRDRLRAALGGRGPREAALATGLGAASSSCSYAAVAIAKSLFEKGASLPSALAFQFASTNLVFELGIVLWLFIGWRFTLAEFVGGIVLIAVMWVALRLFVSREREEALRERAETADAGHVHPVGAGLVAVAHNFRNDWQMLWKEIAAGFLIAGYISLLPRGVFQALFVGPTDVLVGPVVAAAAFVCSVGNVPLAAVLWAGGSSFAGVVAFLFADLLIPPLLAYYRKVYGARGAALIAGSMFVSVVVAALVVTGLFDALGLTPSHRPSLSSVAERPVTWNYTSVLDIVFALVFAGLIALTLRRGATDPVCGMTVDRSTALRLERDGRTYYFCGEGCRSAFSSRSPGAASARSMSHG